MVVPAKEAAAAVALLESTTLGEYLDARHAEPHAQGLFPKKEVVLVATDESVGAAMARLAQAHVLSAPLVLRSSKAHDAYMVLGFISVGDFLRAFVEQAEKEVAFDTPLLPRMAALSALGRDFCASGVVSLHAAEDGDVVFRGATRHMTLLELVRGGFLRMPLQRPPVPPRHRIGVFNEHGALSDIVSMSNIVEWVHARSDRLGALAHRTLAELGLAGGARGADMLPSEEVVCVRADMPCDVAFAVLVHRGVSAAGVQDAASGALVANLSESDFRAFGAHDFGSLALPVGEFLVHKQHLSVSASAESVGEGAAGPAAAAAAPGAVAIRDPYARALHAAGAVITLSPDDTLLRALETLVGRRVHRVYITDPQTKAPLAVVSHTDLLGVLMRGHKPA